MADPLSSKKIAYLVNRYPHPSHTFVRREIAGVESSRLSVSRFSIRPSIEGLVDAKDRRESRNTHVILRKGFWKRGSSALMHLAVKRPLKFIKSTWMALNLGMGSDRGFLRHLVYLMEACILARRFERLGIDHVHAHFGTNPAAVALLVSLLGGPPYSFTVHGPEEFDRAGGISLGIKTEGADFVIAVSSFCRSQLYRLCPPACWRKIQLIRCGVDDEFLGGRLRPVTEVSRFLCLGRLSRNKAQTLLLKAVRQLRDEGLDLKLTLMGDGPMRNEIESRISAYGLQGNVKLTGWADSEQVKREILSSRALVVASFAEGLPVSIMEALALGRPVVSTWVAGIPELVVPGVHGWLVPPGSVGELKAAMKEALQASPQQLTDMGKAGFRTVAASHNSATEARKLRALFLENTAS